LHQAGKIATHSFRLLGIIVVIRLVQFIVAVRSFVVVIND
jgi:hypothetical protein